MEVIPRPTESIIMHWVIQIFHFFQGNKYMFVSACRNSCLIIRVYSFYYPHKGIIMLTAEYLTVHFTLLCPSPLSPESCTCSWCVPDLLWQCHLCPGEGQRHCRKDKRGEVVVALPPVPVHSWGQEAPGDGAPAQEGEDKQHPGVQKHCPKLRWWSEQSQSSSGAQVGKGHQEKLPVMH